MVEGAARAGAPSGTGTTIGSGEPIVVHEDGKPVGVLTRFDLLGYVAKT